jgi:hypothetical protein
VHTGRHPYQVCTLAASTLLGGVLLFDEVARPASVRTAMPPAVQWTWEAGLVAAGVVGLAGVWWRGHPITGLAVETIGIAVLGTVTTMYIVALIGVFGSQGVAAAAFLAGIAGGSWWRIAQIIVTIRRAAAAVDKGT